MRFSALAAWVSLLCVLLAGGGARAQQPAPSPRTHARAVLEQVLSQKAFQRARIESWPMSLQRRFREWLVDLWARTIGRRVGQRRAAELLAWAVASGALIVLIAWLWRLASRERRERPVTIGSIGAQRQPAHVLGQRAAALIAEGNIREGARVAYRAAVSRLEEEGAIRADEARTPRESLRILPAGHRRRPPLSSLTAIFERAWYGSRAPGPAEGDALLAILKEFECLSFDRAK